MFVFIVFAVQFISYVRPFVSLLLNALLKKKKVLDCFPHQDYLRIIFFFRNSKLISVDSCELHHISETAVIVIRHRSFTLSLDVSAKKFLARNRSLEKAPVNSET